jgi:hypothetical protein
LDGVAKPVEGFERDPRREDESQDTTQDATENSHVNVNSFWNGRDLYNLRSERCSSGPKDENTDDAEDKCYLHNNFSIKDKK